jgi:F420-non-reducing hydrogenase iron-sulfur subunit
MGRDFEPEIVVLYCGRSVNEGDHLPEGARKCAGFTARFVMVPCSSEVETVYMVKLIENGTDGVVAVGCPEKDCQFLVGSSRAEGRVEHSRRLLEEVGMGSDRIRMVRRNGLSSEEVLVIAKEQAGAVRRLGQNPMKSTGTRRAGR